MAMRGAEACKKASNTQPQEKSMNAEVTENVTSKLIETEKVDLQAHAGLGEFLYCSCDTPR